MARTTVLINNVDNCIDRFYNNKLDFDAGMKQLFPKANFIGPLNNFRFSAFRYVTAKMASCRHDNAEAYVYAFHFESSNVPHAEWAADIKEISLDKIGMGGDPKTRRSKSGKELPFPNLKYNHTLALFPVKRYGGALALEQAVLDSMPEEDHEKGEWFHSSLGVWKCLLRWHIACFGW